MDRSHQRLTSRSTPLHGGVAFTYTCNGGTSQTSDEPLSFYYVGRCPVAPLKYATITADYPITWSPTTG